MSPPANMFRSVLKASSLIGGASVVNNLIGMIRIKIVAVLLGPSGVGLIGIYGSITGMVGTVAGMGISTSGVRQIAEAFSKGDDLVVARTVTTVRRTVWVTGLLGFLAMVATAWPLSKATFGTGAEWLNLAILGSTIFFGAVAAGQGCLLQGTRRIKELAWVSIVGALNGTLLSLPCYYFWRHQGIVPSLILSALAGVATSWWFARRVPIQTSELPWRASWTEAENLLRFGFPIMLSGLVASLGVYLIRVLLTREVGLEGVGVYQAAFGLSGVLANFVLGAMGTDYYPRLTAAVADPERTRHEINAQTEIALLLATPGLALTLLFAPAVIAIFYSGRFESAVEILRWFVFGIYGRVVSWPLGFLILAKGRGSLFLLSETVTTVLHIGLVWLCVRAWGLPGTGVAFMLLYVLATVWIYGVCTLLSRRLWTLSSLLHVVGLGCVLASIGVTVMCIGNEGVRLASGLAISVGVCIFCLWRLSVRTEISWAALKNRMVG